MLHPRGVLLTHGVVAVRLVGHRKVGRWGAHERLVHHLLLDLGNRLLDHRKLGHRLVHLSAREDRVMFQELDLEVNVA